jgi:hypothetical protein
MQRRLEQIRQDAIDPIQREEQARRDLESINGDWLTRLIRPWHERSRTPG